MQKARFIDENELHNWIVQNVKKFLGEGFFLNGNFFIYTRRNKPAKPDGYFINFKKNEWTIIETELISHGVWPHIAEQITRFSIASKNFNTLRNLRDLFFKEIKRINQVHQISEQIGVAPESLLEHIENIIESSVPNIAIFIDEINEDLEDLAESLNTPISIYKVQKFQINGDIEYFSEDYDNASFQTTFDEIIEDRVNPSDVLATSPNDEIFFRRGRTKFYSNSVGDKYVIKYSRKYDNGGFWYGISPQLLELMTEHNLTHLVLQMGNEGYLKLPVDILTQYIQNANATTIVSQGQEIILHYHIHLNRTPNLELLLPTGNINVERYYSVANI